MAAIKLLGFGGMIPALDERLLPEQAAAYCNNMWLYSGNLRGIAQEKVLFTPDAATTKVYRIPFSYTNAGNLDDSIYLEFENRDTDVLRAPVLNDTFDRYYWVSSSAAPLYNTYARIAYSKNTRTADVTADDSTDFISWANHGLSAGDPVVFTTTGTLPAPLVPGTTYYLTKASVSAGSFKVSTTLANSDDQVSIDLTTAGTGTHTATTGSQPAFTLGVPAPGSPSVGAVVGGSAPTATRAYVVTWVTAYGEEGPPSPAVTQTGNNDGTWPVTLPTVLAADRGVDRYITKQRIYRTVTGESGIATYYLVAELDITETSYDDTNADSAVTANNVLESTTWVAPPADLVGWVQLPNGIFVGWKGKELWFSEPFRPHAWPAEYAFAVEYPIVGLGVINQTLVICTTGFPVTATGVHPEAITTSTLANFEPCASRGSIISSPEGVYYASFNGLVRVVPGRAANITKDILTKDDWQNTLRVATIQSARIGTAIYLFGSATVGVFYDDSFEVGDVFVEEDLTSSLRGMLIDPDNQRVSLSYLSTTEPTILIDNDPWTGVVLIIRDGKLYWIDNADPMPTITPGKWRSKSFQLEKPGNFGAMKVYFTVPPGSPTPPATPNADLVQTLTADQYGLIRVYADGVHVYTRELRSSGELWKLTGGFKADFYQFEFEGRVFVHSIQVASSAKELARV